MSISISVWILYWKGLPTLWTWPNCYGKFVVVLNELHIKYMPWMLDLGNSGMMKWTVKSKWVITSKPPAACGFWATIAHTWNLNDKAIQKCTNSFERCEWSILNLSQRELFHHYIKGLAESHLEYHFQFLSLWCEKNTVALEEKKQKQWKWFRDLGTQGYRKSKTVGLCWLKRRM